MDLLEIEWIFSFRKIIAYFRMENGNENMFSCLRAG